MPNLGDLDPIGILQYSVSQNKYYYLNGAGETTEFPTTINSSGIYTLMFYLDESGFTEQYNDTGLTFTYGTLSGGIFNLTPSTSGLCTAANINCQGSCYNETGTNSYVLQPRPSTNFIAMAHYDIANAPDLGNPFWGQYIVRFFNVG